MKSTSVPASEMSSPHSQPITSSQAVTSKAAKNKLGLTFSLLSIAAVTGVSQAASSSWVTGATGNWSDAANWTNGVPGAAGDSALYSPDNNANSLLNTDETLGSLNYSGRGLWTVVSDGVHSLTMNTGAASAASLTISNRGNLVINPNVVVGDPVNGLQLVAASSSGAGVLTLNGSITGTGPVTINTTASAAAASGVVVNGALNNTGSVTITGNNASQFATLMNIGNNVTKLTKTGASTLNLGGNYALTGAAGTGSIGDTTNVMSLGLLGGSKLTATNGASAVSNKVNVRLAGGELYYSGAGSDIIGGITASGGQGIVTVDPNGAGNAASLTAGTWTSLTNGAVLFRGTNMGSAPGAGVGSIFFTTAPTLSGAGSAGTNTVGIIAHAYGDTSVTGSGAGFVTYDAVNGVRLLDTSTEYSTNSFAANSNVLINGATNLGAAATVNSLLIAGGSVTGANALTISGTSAASSSDILVTGANGGMASNLVMGASTVFFTTVNDLTWSGRNVNATNVAANSAANLVKNGAGTLTLSNLAATGAYTGTTTINGGTVVFGGVGANVLGAVVVNNGGTAKLNINNIFSDGAALTVNTGGTFDFNGRTDTFGSLNGAGLITSTSGTGGLDVNFSAVTLSFGGTITGSMNVSKRGTGTLVLAGTNNTYTGSTSVTAGGALQFAAAGSLSGYGTSGKLTVGSTSSLFVNAGISGVGGWTASEIDTLLSANGNGFANGSFFGIDTTNSGTNFNYGSNLAFSNTVGFIKLGNNTLTLSGNNTYAGKTTIALGGLRVSSLNSVSGGSASSNLGAPVTVAAGTIDFSPTLNATTATLQYIGTGETTDRVINLASAANSTAIIDQSGTGLLKFTSNLTATGASSKTLMLQGSTAGTGEIAGSIVNNSGANVTSVIKAGTGTWTLSGLNTYSGTTTVNAGTLLVNGTHTGGGAYNVAAAAKLGGDGSISATSLTAAAGGKLSPGGDGALGHNFTFALTGAMNLSAASNNTGAYIFDLGSTGSSDMITLTTGVLNVGTLDFADFTFNTVAGFGAGTYVLFDASSAITGTIGTAIGTVGGLSATLSIDSLTNNVLLTVVPEPNTFVLLGAGLGLMGFARRMRRGAGSHKS